MQYNVFYKGHTKNYESVQKIYCAQMTVQRDTEVSERRHLLKQGFYCTSKFNVLRVKTTAFHLS